MGAAKFWSQCALNIRVLQFCLSAQMAFETILFRFLPWPTRHIYFFLYIHGSSYANVSTSPVETTCMLGRDRRYAYTTWSVPRCVRWYYSGLQTPSRLQVCTHFRSLRFALPSSLIRQRPLWTSAHNLHGERLQFASVHSLQNPHSDRLCPDIRTIQRRWGFP